MQKNLLSFDSYTLPHTSVGLHPIRLQTLLPPVFLPYAGLLFLISFRQSPQRACHPLYAPCALPGSLSLATGYTKCRIVHNGNHQDVSPCTLSIPSPWLPLYASGLYPGMEKTPVNLPVSWKALLAEAASQTT